MFEGYSDYANANVRLIVLRALADETDYRMNDALMMNALEMFGHNRSRDYLRGQLRWLQEEVGAIEVKAAGSVLIAKITQSGLDHVEGRHVLTGVQRPSPLKGAL